MVGGKKPPLNGWSTFHMWGTYRQLVHRPQVLDTGMPMGEEEFMITNCVVHDLTSPGVRQRNRSRIDTQRMPGSSFDKPIYTRTNLSPTQPPSPTYDVELGCRYQCPPAEISLFGSQGIPSCFD